MSADDEWGEIPVRRPCLPGERHTFGKLVNDGYGVLPVHRFVCVKCHTPAEVTRSKYKPFTPQYQQAFAHAYRPLHVPPSASFRRYYITHPKH